MFTTDVPGNVEITIGGHNYKGSHININGTMVDVTRIAALAERDQMAGLTYEERSSIYYFGVEKGDVTRWVGWEAARPKVAIEYPALLLALDQLCGAELYLRAQLDRIKP